MEIFSRSLGRWTLRAPVRPGQGVRRCWFRARLRVAVATRPGVWVRRSPENTQASAHWTGRSSRADGRSRRQLSGSQRRDRPHGDVHQDHRAGWFDADGDGTSGVLYISQEGWYALDFDATGSAKPRSSTHPMDRIGGQQVAHRGHWSGSGTIVLDTDGDDAPELLLIDHRIQLFRLVAPWTFEPISKRAFELPPVSVVDAAVSDLNADGLPDVVLGMAMYRGEILTLSGHQDMALMNWDSAVLRPSLSSLQRTGSQRCDLG